MSDRDKTLEDAKYLAAFAHSNDGRYREAFEEGWDAGVDWQAAQSALALYDLGHQLRSIVTDEQPPKPTGASVLAALNDETVCVPRAEYLALKAEIQKYKEKYEWEVADAVQRFASNTSEIEFIPKSIYDQLREKCEELLKANVRETNYAADMKVENDKLRERNERLTTALKSYASKSLWAEHQPCPDLGYEAREALAGEGDRENSF